jgi:hypothetical protein
LIAPHVFAGDRGHPMNGQFRRAREQPLDLVLKVKLVRPENAALPASGSGCDGAGKRARGVGFPFRRSDTPDGRTVLHEQPKMQFAAELWIASFQV